MSEFKLRPTLNLGLTRMGSEGEPLLSIDGVLEQPRELVDYAADQVKFEPVYGPNGGYPGIRAPAPLHYVERLVRALSPSIERAFELGRVKLAKAECSLSLVTLPPGRLAPLQRIPHVDTVEPLQFALLHYLCGRGLGGTAFYRHRATGFETLSAERQSAYEAARARELGELDHSAGYITGDTAHYEQIASIEAGFDKAVVYRSRTLHSGQIPAGVPLSSDPRQGRLTANIFITYRPA